MWKYFYILLLFLFNVAIADDGSLYAYKLIDLETLKVVHEKNSNKLLLPASTHKLITAYAGLKELGGDYRFETKILTDSKVENGDLKGNLYIKFDGNPDFLSKDIAAIAAKIKSLQIKQISGNIVVDDRMFDEKLYPDGWLIENKKFAFAAPISAIVIDQNAFQVGLKEQGNRLELLHEAAYPKLENNAKVISKAVRSNCELELSTRDDNTYRLYGCHRKGEDLPILRIAIQDPRLWVKALLKVEFSQQGIKFRDISFKPTSSTAQYLFGFKSRKLSELISVFLQDSNNLIGEVIFKTLGLKRKGLGSWKYGKEVMEEFVAKQIGVAKTEMQIIDGSGLSRKNLISTNILVYVLQKINQESLELKAVLLSSLPKSNESGTLINRFIDNTILPKGTVIAKTGSMDNISGLAGYIIEGGKARYAFAIMINNSLEDKKELRANEERIITNTVVAVKEEG